MAAAAPSTSSRTRGATAAALLLAAALLAASAPSAFAQSAVPTGQSGVCCAYILAYKGGPWQLVCNNPTNVRAAADHSLPRGSGPAACGRAFRGWQACSRGTRPTCSRSQPLR